MLFSGKALLDSLLYSPLFLLPLGIVPGAAFLCLLLFLLGAAFFGPLLLVPLETAYTFRRKVFHDKLSLQFLQCVCATGIAYCVLFLAGYGCGTLFSPVPPPVSLLIQGIIAPVGYILLLGALLGAHQKLRAAPAMRLVFSLCLALLPGMLILDMAHSFEGQGGIGGVAAAHLPFILLLGLATAAALCQIWLIIRRNRADYGRDYYAFAMRSCARQTLVWTMAHLALMGAFVWFLLRNAPDSAPDVKLQTSLFLFAPPIIACSLWIALIASAAPMRHKPGAILACLLLMLTWCGLLYFFNQFGQLLMPIMGF